jgi:hypothetical protein
MMRHGRDWRAGIASTKSRAMPLLVLQHFGQRWRDIGIEPRREGDLRRVDPDRAVFARVVDANNARDRQSFA